MNQLMRERDIVTTMIMVDERDIVVTIVMADERMILQLFLIR